MGSLTLLLGRTRTRRRSATAHLFTQVDRVGRPELLYVTDSVRKKNTVQREFVRYRRGAAFPPEVTTLGALLDRLVMRHGDGRAPWSARSIGLVAERQVIPGAPWLAALGDPSRVGADLASLFMTWDEAAKPPLAPADAPVEAALHSLDRALRAYPHRISRGDAFAALPARLLAPGPDLGSFLGRWTTVVIDDVLHPAPRPREALMALVAAWRTMGAHIVIGLETGRDLGGAEVATFFDFQDEDDVAFSLRPFAATRRWRHALFTRFVAEGDGEILLAGPDGAREVDGADMDGPQEAPDPTDLAGLADGPERAVVGSLELIEWPDPESEVRGIARAVKEALLSGASPEDLWVAFPGLPAYTPRIRRIFGELGVPITLSAGTALSDLPIAALLSSLLSLPTRGWPMQPMFAALAHDLVALLDEPAALQAARWCRERGVFFGPIDPEVPLTPEAHAALSTLTGALQPFSVPQTGRDWADAVHTLVETLGIVSRADAVDDPELRGAALDALGRCLEVAEAVAKDVSAVAADPWDAARLARLYATALGAARLTDPERGETVQVVGMLELRGVHPRTLWIGGLTAEDLPPPTPEDYLLDRRGRRPLDTLEPVDEMRFLLSSSIRNAIADGHTIRLSWPALRDGNHLARAPLVEDLLAVAVEGDDVGGAAPRLSSRIQRVQALDLDAPLGPAELDRRIGEAEARGVDSAPWRAALGKDDVAERLAPVFARQDPATFGAWDGVLAEPPALRPIGVTAFERFLSCPIRDLFGRVLGLEPEDAWDPDLDAASRGTLLHAILHEVHRGLRAAGVHQLAGQEPARLAPHVEAAVARALAADESTKGLPPALRAWHRSRWLAGLVDDAPKGILAAWLEVECAAEVAAVLDGAETLMPTVTIGPVEIRGRLDRVDRLHGLPLVLDYKTGAAPKPAQVRAGLRVQGPIYLDAMGGDGAAGYVTLRRPDLVERTAWVGSEAALRAMGEKGVVLDGALGDALRAHRTHAAERLKAGTHHPTLASEGDAGCEHCPMRTVCRVDPVRNEGIRALGDPRWVAPLEAS